MSKTHRCNECPQSVEHDDGYEVNTDPNTNTQTYKRVSDSEICPSCGRCAQHCTQIGHKHMGRLFNA